MKHLTNGLLKRITAMILTAVMLATSVPMDVYAAPDGSDGQVSEDTSGTTTEDNTDEESSVSEEDSSQEPGEEETSEPETTDPESSDDPGDPQASPTVTPAATPSVTPSPSALTDDEEEREYNEYEEVTLTDTALPDSEDLLDGYLGNLIENEVGGVNGRRKLYAPRRTNLTGNDLRVYNAMTNAIKSIAAGQRESTVITVSMTDLVGSNKLTYTAKELGLSSITSGEAANTAVNRILGFDSQKVHEALVADLAYDLYWYDKTQGISISRSGFSYNSSRITFPSSNIWTITMYVSKDYSKTDEIRTSSVDRNKTSAATNAVEKAKTVVATYAGEDDYNKLKGYKDWICRNVDYNSDAASSGGPYGNPWQLIWAFDDEPDTTVVCEGYAKAFKLLCDLSTWDWTIFDCYLMSGDVNSQYQPGGAHMWNIVQMDDGKNYLIDVTWCDTNATGQNGTNRYFLKGDLKHGDYSLTDKFIVYNVDQYYSEYTTYTYDASTKRNYTAEERTVNTEDYSYVPSVRLSFDAGEGTCSAAPYKFGENSTTFGAKGPLPTATRKGYKFDGWYTEPDDGDLIDEDTPFNMPDDMTVYAHWAPITYKMVFNPNPYTIPKGNPGHYANVTGETEPTVCAYDESTPLTACGYTSASHRFKYWTTSKDGRGTVYTDEASVLNLSATDGAVINLYAQWEIKHFTVTFDYKCDTFTNKVSNYDYGKYIAVPTQPARTGYIFGGWYTDESFAENTKFDFKNNYVESDLTLYAKWTPVAYRVVFDANQYAIPSGNPGHFGTVIGTTESMQCTYDVPVTLTENGFSSKSHVFKGWNTARNGTGTSYADGAEISNLTVKDGTTITLYAQWEVRHYKVEFDFDCELADKEYTYNYGDYISAPVIPARTGYLFQGWYKDPGYNERFDFNTEQVFAARVNDHAGNDNSLHARWTPITYTIVYDGNGADAPDSVAMTGRECTYDEDPFYLEDNTYKKTGYVFNGWNTKPDGSGENVGFIMPDDENGLQSMQQVQVSNLTAKYGDTVTLYAQWQIVQHRVKIYFNTVTQSPGNDADKCAVQNAAFEQSNIDISVDHGSVIEEPELPVHTGYRFDGWYSDPGLTTAFAFPKTANTDTVVYAKWVKVWNVTIKLNGGYFYDPATSESDSGDVSSFAKMDSVSFTIDDDGVTTIAGAINKNNGMDDYSLNVNWNDPASIKPFRTKYDFAGWFDAQGNEIVFTDIVSSNVIINARWSYKYGVKKPSSYIEAPTQLYVNTGNSTTPAREIGNAAGDVLYESAIIKLTDETVGARIFYATSSNVKDGDDNWHFDPDKWKYYTDGIKVANIPAADKEDLNNGTYKVTVYAYATMADHSDSGVYTKTYIVIKDDSDRGGIVSDSDWAEYLALGRPDSVWVAGVDPDGYIYTGAGITFVPGVDDGNAATHNIRVYDGKKLLTLSKDYTLSYRNNINAYTLIQGDSGFNVSKAPSIVITCRGNFSGSHTKTFKINPQDLSSANTTVVTPVITLVERKNNRGVSQIQKPGNTIRYLLPTNKTVTLRAGSDYILEYANAAADGEFAKARDLAYTVNVHGAYDPVKGVGNYKGDNSYDVYIIASLTYTVTGNVYDSHDANYEIAPKTISVKSGRLELAGIKASDEAEALAILTDEKTKETAEQKDYVYYLENNKNIGTARITFIGNEDKGYAGKVTKTYAITGTNFTKASFNSGLAASYQYTGTGIKPLIPERIEAVDENPAIEASVRYQKSRTEIVSLKGIEENAYALLTDENERRSYDYTYRYEGDTVNIGTVKIVMTGINGYTGSVTRNYKITGISLASVKFTGAYNTAYNALYNINRGTTYNGAPKKLPEEDILTYSYRDANKVMQTYTLKLAKEGETEPDYTVAYYRGNEPTTDFTSAGTITAVYTGVRGYTGTIKRTYRINPMALNANFFTPAYNTEYNKLYNSNRGVAYNGLPQAPSTDGILVRTNVLKPGTEDEYEDITLVKDTDYTVTYYRGNRVTDDLKSVGTITVAYTGKGNYNSVIKRSYKINAYSFVTDEANYTAKQADPAYEPANRISVTLPDDVIYLKGGVRPVPVVTYDVIDDDGNLVDTVDLENGKDFTVTYFNNTAVNVKDGEGNWLNPRKIPYIKITGKGNFAGMIPGIARNQYAPDDQRFLYEIHTSSAASNRVTLEAADRVYTNQRNNYTTSVILTDSDAKRLVAGTDYEKVFHYYYTEDTMLAGVNLSYTEKGMFRRGEVTDEHGNMTALGDEVLSGDIVPVGTIIRIVVDLKGNYAGQLTDTFRLYGQDISRASVRINPQYYTGREVCPDKTQIVITLAGRVLADQDYEIVSYANNINRGTARVTLAGLGDYGGTKTVNFSISNKLSAGTNCIIIFNGNGANVGSMGNQTLGYHDTKLYNLNTNGYKRTNYTFTGWNTKPDGTGEDYTRYVNKRDPIYKQIEAQGTWSSLRISTVDGANNDLVGKTLVLYAQWIPAKYYVVFHNNGGANNPLNNEAILDTDDSLKNLHGLGKLSKDGTGRLYYRSDYQDIKIYSPEREDWPIGYQFGGWYKENTYKNKIAEIKAGSSGDLHLYAKWIPYTYTVKFDGNGANSGKMNPQTFSYGVSKKLTANAYRRNGCQFIGWSKDPNSTIDNRNPEYKNTELVTDLVERRNNQYGEITLYARWEMMYWITFEKDGGTIDHADPSNQAIDASYEGVFDPIYVYQYGKAYKLPTPVKPGYTFGGWYKDNKFRTRLVSVPKTMYGDTTLYAKWTPNTYRIVFNGEGRTAGSVAAQNVRYDSVAKLNANGFVRNGYVFAGWSTKSYAVRTSGMTAEQIAAYDKNPLADPATAIGYYTDAAQIRNPVGPDGNPVLSGTLNLYAIWQKVDNYKVIFEPNGGTDVGDNNVVLRAPGTALNLSVYTPVRRGYVFGGWYRDPAFRTRFTAIGATTYTDITLYAKWTPLTYRVAYNMNYNSVPTAIHRPGKSGSMGVQSARYGTYLTLNANAFAIDGYKFLGWNTSPDMVSGTGYSDRDVVNILPSSNNQLITLYAVWGPVDHYEITLDATGGTLTNNPEAQYQITGEVVQDGRSLYTVNRTVGEKLPLGGFVPVRDGYTFGGWYRDPNYRTVVRDVATNIYSDITVYARWTPKNYKVAFYADAPVDQTTGKPRAASGRMNVITMKYGTEAAISRNAFAVKGHNFLGWSTRPYEERIAGKTSEEIEAYDSDALKTDDVQYTNGVRTSNIDITGDIDNGTTRKLYGVWAKTEYSIVYNNVGGIDNSANPVSYNVDQEIILAEPENMGDTFLGWYSDARMTRRVTSIPKGSTGNKVFYAKWSKTQYTINYNLNCPDDNLAILDTTKTGYITSYDGNTENGYVLATATRKGYDFGGWYREAACRTAVGPIVSSPNIDMTVYARWIPHAYTIKFKSKTPDAPEDLEVMGTMVDRAGIKSGANYVLPAVTYTATGYTFDGWCTEDDFVNRKYTNRATVKDLNLKEGVETDSVTLYAKWNIIEYNIIYELNGGINPVDEEGESINPDKYTIKTDTIVLQDPVKEGYKFEGWFTTKNFTANSKVTEIKKGSKVNLRLYAKWKYMYNSTYVSEVTKPDKRVDAATYNIIPNDGIDDTIAINNAIAAAARNYANASNKAEANNTVYLPAGVYNVTADNTHKNDGEYLCIELKSHVNLVMDREAVLQVAANGERDYAVISCQNINNCRIEGGRIEGERNIHRGTAGENGSGIELNGCDNMTVTNMVILNNWGDGVYVNYKKVWSDYVKCTNITIDHCEMFYNRRNNISIIDVDGLLIDNCYLYDAYGTAPMCAVYIEPNWNSRGRGQNDRNYEEEICRNITIQNTYMASYHRINDTDYGWSFMSHQNPYDNNYVTVDGLKILNCKCYGWFGNYSCSRRDGSFDHTGTVFYGTYRNRDENWRTPY